MVVTWWIVAFLHSESYRERFGGNTIRCVSNIPCYQLALPVPNLQTELLALSIWWTS